MASRRWPYVQRIGDKWRGWVMVEGARKWLPLRPTAQEASEEAIQARKEGRGLAAAAGTQLGALIDAFLEDARSTRRQGTWEYYSQQLGAVAKMLSRTRPVVLVNGAALRDMVSQMRAAGYGAQTIQHRRSALRRLFRWAIRRGLVKTDPTTAIEWPTVEAHAFDVIPQDQLQAVLAKVQQVPRDFDLVAVMLYTGMRLSEIARLRVDEVDLTAGHFWLPGKRRKEAVPIAAEIAASFRALVQRAVDAGRDYVIDRSNAYRGPKRKGGLKLTDAELAQRQRAYTVQNTFRRWARKLKDRRFHPHALRHSLATMLAANDEHAEVVGQIMRHRSYQTTRIYIHLVGEQRRRATARLRVLPPLQQGEQQHG